MDSDDAKDAEEVRQFFEQIKSWSDERLKMVLAELRNSVQELREIARDENPLTHRRRLDAYLFKHIQRIGLLETELEGRTK